MSNQTSIEDCGLPTYAYATKSAYIFLGSCGISLLNYLDDKRMSYNQFLTHHTWTMLQTAKLILVVMAFS